MIPQTTMKILQVTPDEFLQIQGEALECLGPYGSFNEGRWIDFMQKYVGNQYGPFSILVRYDVPYIPLVSLGIKRIEEV